MDNFIVFQHKIKILNRIFKTRDGRKNNKNVAQSSNTCFTRRNYCRRVRYLPYALY